MKQKLNTKNELKRIVEEYKLHLKSQFICLNSITIDDFPKLDKYTIQTKITLGSYQLKQALSYLAEHVNKGKIEIRVNKKNMNYKSSKILFSIIRSRHSKATKYRVYCRYNPDIHTVDGIESWYCTCKAGSRTVGCCCYVASIIYYFAHGIYLKKLPNPSENLLSIFPVPDSYSEDDKTDENNINQAQEKVHLSCSDFESNSNDESSSNDDESSSSDESVNEHLSKSMKRLLSSDDIVSINLKKKKADSRRDINMQYSNGSENIISMSIFEKKLPKWGGHFVNENGLNSIVKITNTCTIDYFLLALWASSSLNSKIIELILTSTFINRHNIVEIINFFQNNEWNKAKTTWLLNMLSLDYSIDCTCDHCVSVLSNGSISTFGSEYEFFLSPLIKLQKYNLLMTCTDSCNQNNIMKESVSLNFQKINNNVS